LFIVINLKHLPIKSVKSVDCLRKNAKNISLLKEYRRFCGF